jgi:hypothetical protein
MFGVASFLRSPAGRRLTGVLGAAALFFVLSPASVAATITHATIATSSFETGLTDDCRPGLTGTLVGTGVTRYTAVETPFGYHIEETDRGTGQITWSDGSYSIIESADHISFNLERGQRVFTNSHQDSANTYTAGGVFLFRLMFFEVTHRTFIDGVLQVEVVRNHLNISGGC